MGRKPLTTQRARPKRDTIKERNIEGYKNSRITTRKAKDSRSANKRDSRKTRNFNEIRLDYLQNLPLNTEISNLIIPSHAFYSIADK